MADEEKQTMNREIAEALIREGLGAYVFEAEPMPAPTRARWLVPHDFTKAEYLFPALEAWRQQKPAARWYRATSAQEGIVAEGLVCNGNAPQRYGEDPEDAITALARAFHAALTEGVTE